MLTETDFAVILFVADNLREADDKEQLVLLASSLVSTPDRERASIDRIVGVSTSGGNYKARIMCWDIERVVGFAGLVSLLGKVEKPTVIPRYIADLYDNTQNGVAFAIGKIQPYVKGEITIEPKKE